MAGTRIGRFDALILAAVLTVACSGGSGERDASPPLDGLTGRVVDIAGAPVPGAVVEAGGSRTLTNSQGQWTLSAPGNAADELALRISHPNHSTAVQPIRSAAFNGKYILVTLRPVLARKRLSASKGGAIVIPSRAGGGSDASLIFPPGFVTARSDDIDVSVSVVRPYVEEELAAFPGSYAAQSSTLPRGGDLLETFGTLEVQLRSGGELLNEGLSRPATLQMRLDASLDTRYGEGATIPTWWLDESTGIWQGEGQARVALQDGKLQAEWDVDHFTWWNIDRPLGEHACLALKVNPTDGDSAAFLKTFAFSLSGADYWSQSNSVPFSAEGLAVATGWRGHKVKPILLDTATGAQTGLSALMLAWLFGDGAVLELPDVTGSGVFGVGPGGRRLDPAQDCLYLEKPFSVALGTVDGYLRDAVGGPVQGGVVSIEELGVSVLTDRSGYFQFSGVPWNPEGSISVRVVALTGANSIVTPVVLVRNQKDQAVALIADVSPEPPYIVTSELEATISAPNGSINFSAVIADDRPMIQVGASVCGKVVTVSAGAPEADTAKVTICHVPPGNPKNEQTISVARSAVEPHLAHGDYVGLCATADVASAPEPDYAQLPAEVDELEQGCTGQVEELAASVTQAAGIYYFSLRGTWKNGTERGLRHLIVIAKDDYGYGAQKALNAYWRNTAPVVSIVGEASLLVGASGTYRVVAADPDGDAVTISWSLDGVKRAETATALVLSGLSPGPHYLVVEAGDGTLVVTKRLTVFVSGSEPPVQPGEVVPETVITTGPPSRTAATAATFSFSSPLTGVTFDCALDTGSFSACVSPYRVENLQQGTHTLAVRAVNQFGTADTSPALVTWEVVEGWIDVETGHAHACARMEGGLLYCWGDNYRGQIGIGSPLWNIDTVSLVDDHNWVDIAASAGWLNSLHGATCGVRIDGSLWCWGLITLAGNMVTVPTNMGSGWQDVDLNNHSGCGRKLGDVLWCWGLNDAGRLGDRTLVSRDFAAPVSDVPAVATYSVGLESACAVDLDGRLWCWGSNVWGQLGIGMGITLATAPQLVDGASDWLDVKVGEVHACARKLDRSLWCWGSSDFGATGFDDVTLQPTPREVAVGWQWIDFSTSGISTCAVRDDTSLWCWGNQYRGEFAIGDRVGIYQTPVSSAAGSGWSRISLGEGFACGLRNRRVYCWGDNRQAQLAHQPPHTFVPRADISKTDWVRVSRISSHRCAIDSAGDLYCWGLGESGCLGNGDTQDRPEKTRVMGWNTWARVATATQPSRTCAIDTQGALWCWGDAQLGVLGNGWTTSYALSAQPVSTGASWAEVALGKVHSCGITTLGELYCWGQEVLHRLGTGVAQFYQAYPVRVTEGTDWTSVSAADETSCALKLDGSLWCWGGNSRGEAGVGHFSPVSRPTRVEPGSAWLKISLGYQHACGIKADYSVWCWGSNGSGQVDGASLAMEITQPTRVGLEFDWVDTIAGTGNSYAVKADGSLWGWGDNSSGALGVGSGSAYAPSPTRVGGATGWTSVGADSGSGCGVRNGTMHCWGRQTDGGFGDGSDWSITPRQVR